MRRKGRICGPRSFMSFIRDRAFSEGAFAERTEPGDRILAPRKKEAPCGPATTPSAQGCHPCLRYVPSPMSPGRTPLALARRKGFEPLTPRFEVWCSIQLSYRRRTMRSARNMPRHGHHGERSMRGARVPLDGPRPRRDAAPGAAEPTSVGDISGAPPVVVSSGGDDAARERVTIDHVVAGGTSGQAPTTRRFRLPSHPEAGAPRCAALR